MELNFPVYRSFAHSFTETYFECSYVPSSALGIGVSGSRTRIPPPMDLQSSLAR